MDSISTIDLIGRIAVTVSLVWVAFQMKGLWQSGFFGHVRLVMLRSHFNPSHESRRAAHLAYSDPFSGETHLSTKNRGNK